MSPASPTTSRPSRRRRSSGNDPFSDDLTASVQCSKTTTPAIWRVLCVQVQTIGPGQAGHLTCSSVVVPGTGSRSVVAWVLMNTLNQVSLMIIDPLWEGTLLLAPIPPHHVGIGAGLIETVVHP